MPAPTFALSIHASYGCRERGACCTAGWPIPIEADRLAAAEAALAQGRLRPPRHSPVVFIRPAAAPTDSPALVATSENACVFYDSTGSARCELQRVLGHSALPLACRQFPRVSVCDPRGTSITLSHFCPTVAEMIAGPGPIEVVTNARAFPPATEYVGLDATTSLPPLLRPDMAMDWESWWLWERLAIDVLGADELPDAALARLRGAVEYARAWQPGHEGLSARIEQAFRQPVSIESGGARRDPDLLDDVRAAVPVELQRPLGPPTAAPSDVVRRHFLAAHAFANWTAYLGLGLRSWLRSLDAADVLLRHTGSVGAADLWLRHLVDPNELAKRVSRAETSPGAF